MARFGKDNNEVETGTFDRGSNGATREISLPLIEYIIKADFREKSEKKYGDKWLTHGMPPKVYKQANALMGKQNYENSINEINKNVTLWDCVTIADCRDIAIFESNWTDLFEQDYTYKNKKWHIEPNWTC